MVPQERAGEVQVTPTYSTRPVAPQAAQFTCRLVPGKRQPEAGLVVM